MKKILIGIIFLMLVVFLNAQIIDNAFKPSLLTPSFLNPNNLSMHHSVSFIGGYSSNNDSFYESVYTNHLMYKFKPNLNLQVDLNFVNFGTATYKSGIEFEGNNDNQSKVLPNFQLNWKPSENTTFTVEFKQYQNPLDYQRRWW